MAYLFPVLRFFDSAGSVLSGGKIYFYIPGTNTLKDVYTDQAAGTTLSNPVVLNSSGIANSGGGIWLSSGQYKIEAVTSEGVRMPGSWDRVGNWFEDIDYSSLTATVTQLNQLSGSTAAGVVSASSTVVADASKNCSKFGNLAAVTLSSSTSLTTPLISDAAGRSSVTIASTASQVNALTVTPAIATGTPVLSATGSDTNIGMTLTPKGSGTVNVSGISYAVSLPSADRFISTNGAGSATVTAELGIARSRYNGSGAVITLPAYVNLSTIVYPMTTLGIIFSTTFTPSSATSTIFMAAVSGAVSTTGTADTYLFLGESSGYPVAAAFNCVFGTQHTNLSLCYTVPSWGLTERIYALAYGADSTAGYVHSQAGVATGIFGGLAGTYLMIREIE